ncbi:hypothetical protein BU23DRAFT_647236 [Bimuria novae-zelandiae CBS 107.79]|uniref:Uncharacterized protein n=1 Tax=Bimuria novae-zelandiae CBS 107.79 TaxID=1447943 RepID=A0A6A5VNA2_9PLEO|nr:hypothetical protein BU23DRAFT_647236 [Bimuria novae-zelandiae CBS 107.79]
MVEGVGVWVASPLYRTSPQKMDYTVTQDRLSTSLQTSLLYISIHFARRASRTFPPSQLSNFQPHIQSGRSTSVPSRILFYNNRHDYPRSRISLPFILCAQQRAHPRQHISRRQAQDRQIHLRHQGPHERRRRHHPRHRVHPRCTFPHQHAHPSTSQAIPSPQMAPQTDLHVRAPRTPRRESPRQAR